MLVSQNVYVFSCVSSLLILVLSYVCSHTVFVLLNTVWGHLPGKGSKASLLEPENAELVLIGTSD